MSRDLVVVDAALHHRHQRRREPRASSASSACWRMRHSFGAAQVLQRIVVQGIELEIDFEPGA